MWTWLTMASPTEIEFSKGLELQDTWGVLPSSHILLFLYTMLFVHRLPLDWLGILFSHVIVAYMIVQIVAFYRNVIIGKYFLKSLDWLNL
jgi:hypothetical protein